MSNRIRYIYLFQLSVTSFQTGCDHCIVRADASVSRKPPHHGYEDVFRSGKAARLITKLVGGTMATNIS